MTTFITGGFDFRNKVHIDSDHSLTAVITGFQWNSATDYLVRIEWMHNGASASAWVQPWRLMFSSRQDDEK